MNKDIFIGIDMGSTGLKAVAFEGESGCSLAVSGSALPFIRLPGSSRSTESTTTGGWTVL